LKAATCIRQPSIVNHRSKIEMCGIAGFFNLKEAPPVSREVTLQMLEMIRHRGPDGFGIYRDERVQLGSARLSIIDLSGGDQPIGNEDDSLWIVFNGEIFNFLELRPELEARGRRFQTHTDTEVILHLYEDYGPECLRWLNGQYAIAIWDRKNQSLFLARDRLGVRLLFYAVHNSRLIFGSEIKAILAHPGMQAEIDPVALNQVFTFWSPLSPGTIFRNIRQIPPGHYLLAQGEKIGIHPYWSLDFGQESQSGHMATEYQEELEALLIDATRIRLREYRQIVAASNFKQRTRMATLYYHAELRNYAVVGTANRNEHGQGFFVKYGDGGVDVAPIVHLFKPRFTSLPGIWASRKRSRPALPRATPTAEEAHRRSSFFESRFVSWT
jgi:hypothetical protein